MTLGQRLKAYREKEGLTQEQFAEYLNVSRQAVTKWETDKGVPDIDNLVAVSRRMGVTLDELVLGQPAGTEPAKDASSFPAAPHAPSVAAPPAAPRRSAGPEAEKNALPDNPAPSGSERGTLPGSGRGTLSGSERGTLPGSGRGTPSERARYYAFAALAFVFAAFCQFIAGCVTLVSAFNRRAPEFLPILNFCSAALCLFTAYVQAVRCSRYRQETRKNTTDP